MKVVIYILIFFGISFSVSANENGCLKKRWSEINSSENDKKFDEQFDKQTDKYPDLKQDPRYYSCDSYLTPSEISNFLSKLKEAVLNKDASKVAKMVKYPIDIALEKDFVDESGRIKQASFRIKNAKQFIANYDRIITQGVSNVIQCSTLSNMFAIPSQGVFLANGEVLLNRNFDNEGDRTIYIVNILAGENFHAKWFQDNCVARDEHK